MLDVEGFILVGGASSRMGADKSQLILGGESVVSRIAREIETLTRRVRLVGARTSDERLTNIPDRFEHWGPLGGINAALQAGTTELSIIVACDLPFVTNELIALLLRNHQHDDTIFDAIVPVQQDHRPQPLCAVYRRDTCLPATEAIITQGKHTPRAMLDQIKTRYVEFEELAALKGSEHFFLNLNRPEDYERAQEIAGGLSSARLA